MLILSRKSNESIVIDGRIIVKVVRVDGDQVKLGIDAPNSVPVHRQEVYDEIQRNNREALTSARPNLPRLPSNGRPHPTGLQGTAAVKLQNLVTTTTKES
ncbi:MAG: carbon storage regulator CsrA [Verrucomicrobiota bacterium]|jgi:carbon storage regulator